MVLELLRPAVVLLCLVAVAPSTDTAGAEQRLADGLALIHANRGSEARPILEACLTDLEGADRRRMVNRLIGHLYWDLAQASDTREDRLRLLDQASERYLVASEDGDLAARRHYLAIEGSLSAERGYAAGWRFISWNGIGAIDGWLVVVGNYGAAMTGGKGIPGLLRYHPYHAAAWGAALAVLLLLAILGLLRKPQVLPPPPPPPPEPPPPPLVKQRTPQPGKRPSSADQAALPRHPASSGRMPAPALRGVKPAIPVPAAGQRTPRPPPLPPSVQRTPKPDLERLRHQHLQNSPQKSETRAYERDEQRRLEPVDDTDPDGGPLVRKPTNRDETEAGGNPILPPGGGRPSPPPPRRPR